MVVGTRRAELVQFADHELGRLDRGHAVEVGHFVEGAVHRAFRRRAVVTDDVVDDRVVEHFEFFEGVHDPAHVVVGVLKEPGVHLHLTLEHRLEFVGHVVPRRDQVTPRGQLGIGGDDTQLLLLGEGPLALLVPPVREHAAVLGDPFVGHMMRGMSRPWRVVDEERLVGHQRLLLADPAHAVVSEVVGEVVTLLGGRRRLDWRRALVQRRFPLVVLAADEPIEMLEAAALRRPGVERPHRRGLPHRYLVALPELGCRVAIQRQRRRQRRHRVGAHRTLPGRRGGGFSDAAHPHRVMVPARQQRLARRRAERRGVEPVVPQSSRRKSFRCRRLARPTERAGSTETDIVEQDHQHIWSARRAGAEAGSEETRSPDPSRHTSSTQQQVGRESATCRVNAGQDSSQRTS